MNILIINLPRHADRLAFQREQMERLGLSFQVLNAVDVTTLPDDTFQKLAGTWERPMRKVEVCCFLSHKAAWQSVLDNNQPALILEDDALLANTVPNLLSELSTLTETDIAVLEVRARKKIVGKCPISTTRNNHLLALFQDRTGSAGYVVWPSGAEKLLAKANSGLVEPSDAFISSLYTLRALQAEPAAIIQLDMCEKYGLPSPMATASSIGAVSRPVIPKTRALFFCRRLLAQLRMARRILSVWHKAERRYITLNQQHFK